MWGRKVHRNRNCIQIQNSDKTEILQLFLKPNLKILYPHLKSRS
ncbi:hypothetical protein LEP1GSC103_0752 [Leptospira borgpetersenii serovar Javanica str. UI 09931]|uniref:Uncharacterized protein n=3 Tax=Leptospira borgpetersenii TaxID=174 RepID=M3HHW1_LEPBO|nr:hypothetical protein LEP1GSC128_1086 [Leptospira borgpetersenii str. 200801926]EKQ91527.1 hypothetical protein LEP1GSC101_1086 [Leptospira borgpetersenii str. UI 09149]EKR00985.1 hypothetical protein LEP1GSC121_1632 [Leptospira borgpetersenii serovar Castellonis str. 200801910]EMF97695.1 hypothetical protein LEP1GSC123_1234 [Leptospira borgpetersenii str. 200701203]EMO09487.1 hypothetical protein LEP1GSC137_0346 [Leptospira borgpetersenii str. Noumea 25]EPG56062.1 hypothetical protein LEP1G